MAHEHGVEVIPAEPLVPLEEGPPSRRSAGPPAFPKGTPKVDVSGEAVDKDCQLKWKKTSKSVLTPSEAFGLTAYTPSSQMSPA